MSSLAMDSPGEVSPHWLARLLGLTRPWRAHWHAADRLRVVAQGQAQDHPAIDLEAKPIRGWLFTKLELNSADQVQLLRGMRPETADELLEQVNRRRLRAIEQLREALTHDLAVLEPLSNGIRVAMTSKFYLAALERELLVGWVRQYQVHIGVAWKRVSTPHAERFPQLAAKLKRFLPALVAFAGDPEAKLAERNERFVEEEWRRWEPFFAVCERTALTEEQGKAAITMEEATLLVAAAGSGKTSTVVGKVAYMLAKGIADPEEILCLAFNNAAAKEIGTRLKERLAFILSDGCVLDESFKGRLRQALAHEGEVASKTFHSFGNSIVRQVEKKKPKIVKERKRKELITTAINECRKDPVLGEKWWLLQTVYRLADPVEARFRTYDEYQAYLKAICRDRLQGQGIATMGTTSPVRSLEEAAISDWLYLNGVRFEYEPDFAEGAKVLCPDHSWHPDFGYRIQGEDGPVLIVHEHFGLNAQGRAPAFFKNPEGYALQAYEKQAVLQQLDERHFWTTSAEYRDGTLFTKLREKLKALGVVFAPPTEAQKDRRLTEIGLKTSNYLLEKAVSQIRANEWSYTDLEPRISEQSGTMRATLFLELAVAVADKFTEILIQNGQLDYDSMIRRAIGYLRDDPSRSPYRVILADEFQDTATGRGKLVRAALADKPKARLFAVGDDWQAINRFAGSDISLFTGFEDAFAQRPGGYVRRDLTKTFRTNQGIADVSTAFILKNPSQLPKTVQAHDLTRKGVIDIRTYRRDEEVLPLIDAQIRRWVESFDGEGKPLVLLLGRNRPKFLKGIDDEQIEKLEQEWGDRVKFIEKDRKRSLYLTMHGSKGLQADYVLILGMHRIHHNFFCFPSERDEDPLMQLVLPAKEQMGDSDERRLFYVALTRAKRQVVLLTQDRHPSRFVLELLDEHRDGPLLFNGSETLTKTCPRCRNSMLVKRVNGVTGREFWGCGNWPACSGPA